VAMRPSLPVPTISRRTRLILTAVAVVIVALSVLGSLMSLYIDWLWFGEVGYRKVFSTVLWTRILLFVVFGVLMAAVVGTNLIAAYKMRPPFRPMSVEQQNLERYRSAIEPRRALLLGIAMALLGLFAGITAQGQWRTWLLFWHKTAFGIVDQQFHKDISFFAFSYPFYRFLLGFGFAAVVFSLLGAVAVHYLFGGLRIQTPGEKVTPAARVHVSVLLGAFVVLKAIAYFLDRYGLVFSDRGNITGASYTDVNAVLPAKTILMIIAVICAVAFFANIAFRNFQLPAIALVLLVLSSVIIGGAYPALIQNFRVKPNADRLESTYIGRNIQATRQAYGLENINYQDYQAVSTVDANTQTQIRNDKTTVPNARLMDPNVLAPTFDTFQKILNFYNFADKLDIDRYTIDNQQQEYVVGARELDPTQLSGNQTNWINQHLVYTHGNGFVAAPTNQIASGGQPDFVDQSLFKINEPRIYYGELFGDTYSIVGKTGGQTDREFDSLQENQDIKYTYQGSGGVNVGNFFNRLVFAWHYRAQQILFSSAVSGDSKIMFVRDPRDRIEKAAPFLTADGDPYPAVVDGKIVWIVDCYTTLDGFPYSEHTRLGEATTDSLTGTGTRGQANEQVNYIRNSVKATVDAYNGTVTLYQFGKTDPVLESWKKVFPGLIKPESDISPELRAHLRYPEDLFKVQRDLITKYHLDDPVQFFNNQGFWNVPTDPTRDSQQAQPPYYLIAKMPNQENGSFQLTSALNQFQRQNMAAYVSVSSDPSDYGTFRVLKLPNNTSILGPTQVFSNFNSNEDIKKDISLLNQNGSKVVFGNLLTLPVGGGLMYVMPVYVQGSGNPYPLLRRVIVSFGDKVAYETTLPKALDTVFGPGSGTQVGGVNPPPGTGTPTTPPSSGTATPTAPGGTLSPALAAAVTRLNTAFEHVRAAQRSGNLAELGQALEELSSALDAFNAANKPASSPTPSGTPSPTATR
jgi:uncharacterized protein